MAGIPIKKIPSRKLEESKIAANWLKRAEECLNVEQKDLFKRALLSANISPLDIENADNLNQGHVDKVLGYLSQSVPDITLKTLMKLELPDLGLIGYAAINSESLGDALRIMRRYHEMTSDRFYDVLEIREQIAIIKPVPLLGFLAQTQNIAEDSITGSLRAIKLLIGDKIDYSNCHACFDFPAPDYESTYHDLYGCCCHFDTETNELKFPAEWLDKPIKVANHAVIDLCAAMCDRVLGVDSHSDIVQVVQRLLLSRHGRNMLSLEQAANNLNLSVSQFRKRLYRVGTSYKKVVLSVRMSLAKHYLENTTLAVQEIAYLLDYTQAAPFSRAFKNHFGTSPQQYRNQLSATA